MRTVRPCHTTSRGIPTFTDTNVPTCPNLRRRPRRSQVITVPGSGRAAEHVHKFMINAVEGRLRPVGRSEGRPTATARAGLGRRRR
ncbi:hypothetical protein CS0771_26170 [Catellatospora sp. IY07-71]|nr:hypothetical protein CS0771_26170 [Catellatospora sp. IY07-71]